MIYPNRESISLLLNSFFETTNSLMVFPVFSDSLKSSADFRYPIFGVSKVTITGLFSISLRNLFLFAVRFHQLDLQKILARNF